MSRLTAVLLASLLSLTLRLGAQVPAAEVQISGAVSAAPESLRAGATVLGYTNYHKLVTLRQGTNALICLADDPSEAMWHVACYHRDLEPFMALGRELRNQGRTRAEIDSLRLAAVEAGTIKMPNHPTALFSLFGRGDSVDAATGVAKGAVPLYVIYIPYATGESTGLPTQPSGGPWLMFPGKPWAHIMISK